MSSEKVLANLVRALESEDRRKSRERNKRPKKKSTRKRASSRKVLSSIDRRIGHLEQLENREYRAMRRTKRKSGAAKKKSGGKLTGARKAAFLARMAKGRKKSSRR